MSEDVKVTSDNKLKYNRAYYAKNKERIREQKKKRYQSDAEYRESLNLKRRKSRPLIDTTLVDGKEEEVAYDCVMKVLSPDQTKSCVCKMYTMSGTAQKIKVKKEKLIHWIYLEKLPNARYRNASNWRLFTEFEVEIMQKAFAKFRRKATQNNYRFKLDKELTDYINNKFADLIGGIPVESFTEEA
jgi:hypothetical protein